MRARACGVALAAAAWAVLAAAPAAHARDIVVRSFDGTPIVAHFFPVPGLGPSERAPTILWGHGFGGAGATAPNADIPPPKADFTGEGRDERLTGVILRNGANVLTWDARGFGGSGGNVSLDDPRIDGRDVQALIDYVAQQPEVQLDRAGDPRLAMAGASYGGGIQFAAASIDARIDVLVPAAMWNSLATSVIRNGVVKFGWDSLLLAGGATALSGGVSSPAGPQLGAFDPPIYSALVNAVTTGTFTDEQLKYFADKGPAGRLDRIRVPTLIVQGSVDTLFTLDEAIRDYRALKANGVPVKMLGSAAVTASASARAGPPSRSRKSPSDGSRAT